jgi:hypothetical protein
MSDVFLSCSPESRQHAEALSQALQRRGISTWLDIKDLKAGTPWEEQIRRAMEAARIIAFLIDPKSGPSMYQEREYMAALEFSWADKSKLLLPVVIGEAGIPAFLRDRMAFRVHNTEKDWERAADVVIKMLQERTPGRVSKGLEKERTQRLKAIEEGANNLRYVEAMRTLVDAFRHLAKSDPIGNRAPIELLLEHVRTRFKSSDIPIELQYASREFYLPKEETKQLR